MRSSERERFDALVAPEPMSGCWLWLGRLTDKGYGRFGRGSPAHGVSYRLAGRRVDPGMELDHKCRQRCCVNPDHLEPVTHRVNLLRGDTIARRSASRTECPAGHAYSPENTAIHSNKRHCRECDRARHTAAYRPTSSRRRRKHLNRVEIESIRRSIEIGETRPSIAARLNVSLSTIQRWSTR